MIPPVIKPGTARRLGLRPPPILGLIRFGQAITEEQQAELVKVFTKSAGSGRWKVQVLGEPPRLLPNLPIAGRRKRLGLRWWKREAR